MIRTLYPNHFSWAKSYAPFQFNTSIQSTQSVESFNGIIKKLLNNASTLCDVEKAIEKKLKNESQYNKLVDLKAYYAISGLSHIFLQFFTSIDAILVQFLTPLVLSWQ
ncbi:39708_t:CDS:1 [Gigaspora margarita]|uniref:39708_t:CDS:1 n=1 Tax=Gigaspora margarita TaxID=4874 RepID=A0ABN7UJI9_GIGMA|nr:39708_t:CDS:1 [Gigaspora margarita]